MQEEVWKQYKDTIYEVSNKGGLRSTNYLGHGKTQNMRVRENEKGYLQCCLTINGHRHEKKIHRLVAETFLPGVEGKNEVNHKDGDKHNNCVENLEWCTRQENMRHAHENGMMVGMYEYAKSVSKRIFAKYIATGEITYYDSTEQASREMGIRRSNIYCVIHGKYRSSHGYIFGYASE